MKEPKLDEHGKIIPDAKAVRDYITNPALNPKTDAERADLYRDAQAATLLRSLGYREDPQRPGSFFKPRN